MKYLLFTIILILSLGADAGASTRAPDFHVKSGVLKGGVELKATPPQGLHINTAAPMALQISGEHQKIKPTRSSKSEAVFDVPTGPSSSGEISLYLCDNANTFCERHQVPVHWKNPSAKQTSASSRSSLEPLQKSVKKASSKPEVARAAIDKDGFYDNLPEDAFQRAKSTGKPLMIDFYGIWCPPCNDLKERVFSTSAFRKSSTQFVKLKLDADSAATEALSERYRISGYPTVIFASPKGDEISRVVGFRPLKEFLADMHNALLHRKATFSALKDRANHGNIKAREKLGLIYYDREEFALAAKYLKGSKRYLEKELSSQVGLYSEKFESGDQSARGPWIQALRKEIQAFPATPDSVYRRDDLAGLLDKDKKTAEARKVRLQLIESARKLIGHPAAQKGYDITDGDLWVEIAQSYDALKEKKQAESAWESAISVYRRKIASGSQRGASLDLAYCLSQTGKSAEAEKIYQKMQKAYPKEFTFWFADARLNFKAGHFDKARDLAKKAFAVSYGANHLVSARILAMAYEKLSKPELGRKVIAQALQSLPPLPPGWQNKKWMGRFRYKVGELLKLDQELKSRSHG